jgi:hypothetical protein
MTSRLHRVIRRGRSYAWHSGGWTDHSTRSLNLLEPTVAALKAPKHQEWRSACTTSRRPRSAHLQGLRTRRRYRDRAAGGTRTRLRRPAGAVAPQRDRAPPPGTAALDGTTPKVVRRGRGECLLRRCAVQLETSNRDSLAADKPVDQEEIAPSEAASVWPLAAVAPSADSSSPSRNRQTARDTSIVMIAALETHHSQMAWIENSSR